MASAIRHVSGAAISCGSRAVPPCHSPTRKEVCHDRNHHVVTRSGVRLCYDTFGNPDDPPLLLIQGLGAQMVGWHPEFCAQLADAGFFVIRHDNRDIGLSQKFPAGDYTLTTWPPTAPTSSTPWLCRQHTSSVNPWAG